MHKALFSSAKTDWCTPQALFDALDAEFGFTLDAAATERSAKCERFFTKAGNGLAQSWGGGCVFCNPPYGREIGAWVKKAHAEAQSGLTIVLLLPARTDTAWFHEYLYGQAELRFLRGRVRFTDEDGNAYSSAPFPSMVAVFNPPMGKIAS